MKDMEFVDSLDVSTRHRRRSAVKIATDILQRVYFAEVENIERMDMRGVGHGSRAYASADSAVDHVIEALMASFYAYNE